MSNETSYEALVEQLEQCVRSLESDPLGLEQALERYETGHRLLNQAQARLAALEGRMERLLEDGRREPLTEESH